MILKTLTMGKARKVFEGKNETWVSTKLEYEVNAEDYEIASVEEEIEYILDQLEIKERQRWDRQSGKS